MNKIGSYECSCPKGYRLMGEDCVGRFLKHNRDKKKNKENKE